MVIVKLGFLIVLVLFVCSKFSFFFLMGVFFLEYVKDSGFSSVGDI